ncbi:armadillo-type protein [Coniella lustricola]|uniref:Armadillo-type protein n=1 Tax=Coniella lustricola TaxID=2025994 RepID=A0A2T3AGA6_9PEZI|nr:armadillo-type protein [Coniella lustricola]
MAWQPSPESLQTLAVYLKDSLSGFDKAAQKKAELMLSQAKTSPDFNNYLACLFSTPAPPQGLNLSAQDYSLVRSAAAIMLKNNVRLHFKQIPEPSLALIKLAIPLGIQDKSPQIRSYAGNIATELISRVGIYSWPEFLPELLKLIGNESGQVSPEGQEGAMAAMAKICEDNFKILQREQNGQRPLNYLLPKFIQATKSSLPKVRAQALTAINVFTPRKTQAMLNCIDDLLQALFTLSNDADTDVRRQVCRCFVQLVDTRPDKLTPHIAGLVDYIISQQKCEDEELACEAAEFWLTVGEHENLWQALGPYIHKIIPVLLESMVYSGEDIAVLGGASDDEEEEDRAEDIKPQFAQSKSARKLAAHHSADANENGNAYQKLASMDDDLEEGEIDELDDEFGDENPDEKWTLRKCSAAALDVFARDFRDPVFDCILPYLTTNLKHEEWYRREAAVLALGAVAEGCITVVTPHLPELVQYLISLLNDPEPVVRQITCWTLGRYSAWAANLKDPQQVQAYFVPMMEGILHKMLDKNKKVQEAGASAMANLEEKAGKVLEPYTGPIVQQYIRCFAKYKDKNMYILYDCVQTLAENVGPILALPEHSNLLMPSLIDRWHKVSDDSREVFPLLECLSYVAMAMRDAFAPYAQPIFRRCVTIIHQNLEQTLAAKTNQNYDQPDKDFLVTSIDLLSAIIQCLEDDKAQALVNDADPAFFELLNLCMEDPADEVRQSAYALLGDCAKYVFPQLRNHLNSIFPILLRQLDFENVVDEDIEGCFSVVNNACWSAGEIAIQNGQAMSPYVSDLMERFVQIMVNPTVPVSVTENAAIALGRLGLQNADVLAPHLSTFADEFLSAMTELDSTDEKASALKGFTMVVGQNPQAMENSMLAYFQCIAQYNTGLPSDMNRELHNLFQKIIDVYRQMIPQFDQFLNQLASEDLQALKASYTF